ncbi:MAG TPA: inorganic phosphate transporter [Sphingomicrobium sp.]|nr:inorganic phosphate transporter [Sphingomicrobium sp.]
MEPTLALPALIALIFVALAFDFMNGLHDAANSIATIVSTRVLTPQMAVLWAAFFNFVAFAFIGLHVAETVGKGIIDPAIVDPAVIFGALAGAILWNVLTWYLGIPTSSSHALVGGLVGAGVAKGGLGAIVSSGVIKTTVFIFAAPILGMLMAMIMVVFTSWLFKPVPANSADKAFRRLQLLSSAAYSVGHGANDAQKTMGIITVLLFSTGYLHGHFHVPLWVVLAAQVAMGLGTLMGGWRIVHTMGSKITRLTPHQGFCAETGGAAMLFGATAFGIPVSTTHVITGCIMGVGAARRASAVRWGVAADLVIAWVLTIPATAATAALVYLLARAI